MIILPADLVVSEAELRAAERLLYRECELLNRGRYEEWLALFAEDGCYWAPLTSDQKSPHTHSSLFFENRELMRMRIDRITHATAHSLAGGIQTSRIVGPAALREVDENGGEWVVERRFSLSELQGERTRQFAGRYAYRLQPDQGGFLIRQKRVDLINCGAPHEPLEVFL